MTPTDHAVAVLTRAPTMQAFAENGPFTFTITSNLVKKVGPQVLLYDLFAPTSRDKTPLVVLVHGNLSRKEAHHGQAQHLASHGFHVAILQLRSHSQWLSNGDLLQAFVRHLQNDLALLLPNADTSRMILAGHSFGGSAVVSAASQLKDIRGLVLLDPALSDPQIVASMRRIMMPMVILQADQRLYRAKGRELFASVPLGPICELEFKGATHNDAQYPSQYALSGYGFDPYTTPKVQRRMSVALTASAFSLGYMHSTIWVEQAASAWPSSYLSTVRNRPALKWHADDTRRLKL